MDISNLQLVINYGNEAKDCPFTVEQLVKNSYVVAGWGYREVWPTTSWMLKEIKSTQLFVQFDQDYSAIQKMRTQWCEAAKIHRDNHQTFLIGFRGINHTRLYFVMFHDGNILIGTEARHEYYR